MEPETLSFLRILVPKYLNRYPEAFWTHAEPNSWYRGYQFSSSKADSKRGFHCGRMGRPFGIGTNLPMASVGFYPNQPSSCFNERMLDTLSVSVNGKGIIGANNFGNEWLDREPTKYTFGKASPPGLVLDTISWSDYAKQFKYVSQPRAPRRWVVLCHWQSVPRPVGLVELLADHGINFHYLGIYERLAHPSLWWGHVMFYCMKWFPVRNPAINLWNTPRWSVFFIDSLVLYANGNDIYRWLFK